MKYLLILFSVLQGVVLPTQEVDQMFDGYVIVTARKVSIRSAPDINSKIIGFADQEDWLKVIDLREGDSNIVTVDGNLDSWANIEYNGLSGYVFGTYIAKNSIVKIPNSNFDRKYLILSEHRRLSEVTYSSDLNWYGIYSKEDGEYIEKVEISIEFIPETEHPELELENHLKVLTNKSLKSKLLIGTNEPMEIGRIGIKVPHYYRRRMHNNIRIPIPFISDSCTVNNSYYIYGGNSTDDNNKCFLENYRVSLRKDNSRRSDVIFQFEELVENLGGEGRDGCNIPSLYWYGDINNDEIPDIVFYTSKINFGKCKVYLSKIENDQITYNKPVVFQPIFQMG